MELKGSRTEQNLMTAFAAASDEPSAGAAASVAGAAVSAGFSELPHAVSDSAIVAAIANATIFFIIISSLTYCAFLLHNLF